MNAAHSRKNAKLEFLRFLFAVVIVLFHAGCVNDCPPAIFPSGYLPTEFFFLLSGFFLAGSAMRKSTENAKVLPELGHELRKRAFPIWRHALLPFCVLFVLAHMADFLFLLKGQGGLRQIITGALTGSFELFFLTMLGTYHRFPLYNQPVWFFSSLLISVVILYPILRKSRKSFFVFFASVFLFAAYGYLAAAYGSLKTVAHPLLFGYSGTLRALAGLTLGCVLRCLSDRKKAAFFTFISSESQRFPIVSLSEIGLVLAVLFLMHNNESGFTDFLTVFLFAVLLFLAATETSVWDSVLDNAAVLFLGKLSGYLFISHWVIVSILCNFSISIANLTAPVYYSLFVLSALIAALIDMAAVRLGSRLLRRRSTPSVV